MKIRDLNLETIKVNWKELKELQPDNLKVPYNNENVKKSIAKNNFGFAFQGWRDSKNNIYLLDGHLRKDILFELENDGFDIPEELTVNLIDLKSKKEAIKYLLEVHNSKVNPMDSLVVTDWLQIEEIEIDEINFESLNVQISFNDESENEEEIEGGAGNKSVDNDIYLNVKCLTERDAENLYNDLNKKGYECKIIS